jgi:hypothetical protein
MELTLRDFRKQTNKNLNQILDELREISPEIVPSAPAGVLNWENQGIRDIRVIRALAKVYGQDESAVATAALSAKESFQKKQSEKLTTLVNTT